MYELVAADALAADQSASLRAIYERGYTAAERAPWHRVSLDHPNNETLALMRDDVPVGFASTHPLSDTGRILLRYPVIDGDLRGRGLGALLWQRVTELASQRGFAQLVWDVAPNDDEPATEHEEQDSQLRRIGFFERLGGSLLPIGEYASSPGAGTRWVPMRLLATSLDGSALATDPWTLRRVALEVCAYRYQLGVRV